MLHRPLLTRTAWLLGVGGADRAGEGRSWRVGQGAGPGGVPPETFSFQRIAISSQTLLSFSPTRVLGGGFKILALVTSHCVGRHLLIPQQGPPEKPHSPTVFPLCLLPSEDAELGQAGGPRGGSGRALARWFLPLASGSVCSVCGSRGQVGEMGFREHIGVVPFSSLFTGLF